MPIGKNKMAHKIPRQVKSSSNIPTRHAGQAPTAIMGGGMIMLVAPQFGTKAVCGVVPYGVQPGGGGNDPWGGGGGGGG